MVCHETYKDNNNNWLSPEEVETQDGKNYFLKSNKSTKINVGPSESMSKSKKNTIDPQNIINNYGADAVRFFILSDSPPEKDVQWSDQGMISSYKFIQKFWSLHQKIIEKIRKNNSSEEKIVDLEIFVNQSIDKLTKNLENFHYNVIIANLHEIYNYFSKNIDEINNTEQLFENYKKILISILPIIPHLASECLDDINVKENITWPTIDKKLLINDEVNIVVQINGKKRDLITIKKEIDEKEIIKIVKKNEKLKKYLTENKIKKSIFVKNKLINLIT